MARLFRIIGALLGLVLIIAGLPLLLSPVPVGLVMIAVGAILLAASSRRVRAFIRAERRKHPRLNQTLDAAETGAPRPLRRPLQSTRPDRP